MNLKFITKIFIFLIILVISLVVIVSINNSSSNPPKSFRIYYNKINPTILQEMPNYKLNIVEASFFNDKDVNYIHDNFSQVVGYLSLIEIGYWDKPLVEDLNEEDYLRDSNNEKLKSLSKKNYLGDLSSPHFREVLFKYLDSRILDKGMDGIFFDTLDWIDYYKNDEEIYDKLTSGYKALLIELREKYPKIIIVQNRSFESYTLFSYKFIDGILWENFKSPYITQNTKKIDLLNKIQKTAKKNITDVFAISFENEDLNRALADKLNWNFLYSQMENRYSSWNISVK